MGMFDYVYCEIPLEVLGLAPEKEFQTKDFECVMNKYIISQDGRLMRSWYGWAEKKLLEPTDVNYHGWFDFYGGDFEPTDDGERYHSYDYAAKFTDGQLQVIEYKGDHWAGSNVISMERWLEKEGFGDSDDETRPTGEPASPSEPGEDETIGDSP
jgi:hypothetical protein